MTQYTVDLKYNRRANRDFVTLLEQVFGPEQVDWTRGQRYFGENEIRVTYHRGRVQYHAQTPGAVLWMIMNTPKVARTAYPGDCCPLPEVPCSPDPSSV